MKGKYLVLGFTAVLSMAFVSDVHERDSLLVSSIIQGLSYSHYAPANIDDNFSKNVYKEYLERLDPAKRFFIQEDINALNAYEFKIDDEIKASEYNFFDLSNELLEKRITVVKSFYQSLLSNPFDFNIDENIELKSNTYATDLVQLKDNWRKELKFQVMTKLITMLENQESLVAKNPDSTFDIKTVEQLELEARTKVSSDFEKYFDRLSKIEHKDEMDQYVNTITSLYDPHTNYFPPKDKKSFDIRMSGQLEGIGAQLREEDGYLKIAEIVPGAPAYKEGTLKAGFVIMKVAQGDKEPVDIFNMDQDDAIELIRGKKGTEVRLTVKNLQNEVQVISLIRDVVQLQDTFAKSALLENQGDKIGYIFLPQFYANFSNTTNGRSCSDDIKKEIQKLQSEGAQGIILDLRNNGGGSLNDVVSMSGFFFKEGPVVQVRSRGEKPTLLNDRDSKVLYEGQLIVMVNELSASASEILAAALQDYKRAVIVGSNSTYGKGTVQRFINMPQDLGAVKLTVQKFYRINGGATQLRGVNSDIVIPDEYSLLTLGERENESAMPWDEIPAAKYETWGKAPNIEKLRKKSYARISKNPTFELITEKAENNKNAREKTVYSLNMQGYQKEKAEKKEYEKKFTKISNEIPDMKPSLLEVDKILLKATPEDLTEREKWLVSLKKDPILFETVLIMKDMIQ